MTAIGQLSFDVGLHPDLAARPNHPGVVGATLAVKGSFPVHVNLDHGDRLTVTIANADGEVLATSECVIAAPPRFLPVEDKDLGLLGYERSHTCKPDDD